MSDPRQLKSILLEDASTEQKKQFAEMLANECAEADLRAKGHKCWFQIPTAVEYERMNKYAGHKCPKCNTRLYVEISFRDSAFGDTWNLVCFNKECDFKEYISDDE